MSLETPFLRDRRRRSDRKTWGEKSYPSSTETNVALFTNKKIFMSLRRREAASRRVRSEAIPNPCGCFISLTRPSQ